MFRFEFLGRHGGREGKVPFNPALVLGSQIYAHRLLLGWARGGCAEGGEEGDSSQEQAFPPHWLQSAFTHIGTHTHMYILVCFPPLSPHRRGNF